MKIENYVTTKDLIINHRQHIPLYLHIIEAQLSGDGKSALAICNGIAQSV